MGVLDLFLIWDGWWVSWVVEIYTFSVDKSGGKFGVGLKSSVILGQSAVVIFYTVFLDLLFINNLRAIFYLD